MRPGWRRKGVGGAFVTALLEEAGKNFARVRLRTDNPAAARLYERLGLASKEEPSATHILVFTPTGDPA